MKSPLQDDNADSAKVLLNKCENSYSDRNAYMRLSRKMGAKKNKQLYPDLVEAWGLLVDLRHKPDYDNARGLPIDRATHLLGFNEYPWGDFPAGPPPYCRSVLPTFAEYAFILKHLGLALQLAVARIPAWVQGSRSKL